VYASYTEIIVEKTVKKIVEFEKAIANIEKILSHTLHKADFCTSKMWVF